MAGPVRGDERAAHVNEVAGTRVQRRPPPLPACSGTGDPKPASSAAANLPTAASLPPPPPSGSSVSSSESPSSSSKPSQPAWLRNHWSSARVSWRCAGAAAALQDAAAAADQDNGGDAAAVGLMSAWTTEGPWAGWDTANGLTLAGADTAGTCCLTAEDGAASGPCSSSAGAPPSRSPSSFSSSSSARLRLCSLGRGRSPSMPSSSLPPAEQQASSPPSLPPPPENVASAGKRAGTEAGASRSGAGTARETLCLTGHPGAAAASPPTAAAAGPWAGIRAAVPLATASPASAIIGADPSCRRILLTMSAAMLLSVVAARRPGGMRFCRAGPEGGRAPPLTTSAATPYVESPQRARLSRLLPCCGSSDPPGMPEV